MSNSSTFTALLVSIHANYLGHYLSVGRLTPAIHSLILTVVQLEYSKTLYSRIPLSQFPKNPLCESDCYFSMHIFLEFDYSIQRYRASFYYCYISGLSQSLISNITFVCSTLTTNNVYYC